VHGGAPKVECNICRPEFSARHFAAIPSFCWRTNQYQLGHISSRYAGELTSTHPLAAATSYQREELLQRDKDIPYTTTNRELVNARYICRAAILHITASLVDIK
jgi:hypothetical protein